MATAPRDTPVNVDEESTAIGVSDDSMAGRRRRKLRKTRRGGSWKFSGFVPQTVNTANPPPRNTPQGPLGGRRHRKRKTRKHTRSRKH